MPRPEASGDRPDEGNLGEDYRTIFQKVPFSRPDPRLKAKRAAKET
jgi:hypothetical protein